MMSKTFIRWLSAADNSEAEPSSNKQQIEMVVQIDFFMLVARFNLLVGKEAPDAWYRRRRQDRRSPE